ncbi:hypothetical protein CRENBAI_024221, partial [Crenichthys baileyi]
MLNTSQQLSHSRAGETQPPRKHRYQTVLEQQLYNPALSDIHSRQEASHVFSSSAGEKIMYTFQPVEIL